GGGGWDGRASVGPPAAEPDADDSARSERDAPADPGDRRDEQPERGGDLHAAANRPADPVAAAILGDAGAAAAVAAHSIARAEADARAHRRSTGAHRPAAANRVSREMRG